MPWSERKDLSAELLQHGANLRAVAITSLWVTSGRFNNDICAHSSVLSVSWSQRFACAAELDGDDYFSNLFASFKVAVCNNDLFEGKDFGDRRPQSTCGKALANNRRPQLR
jgi:hypothetical protein